MGTSGIPTSASTDGFAQARAAVTDPARLAAVRATGLLDSETEEAFDRLTRLAVRLVHVPAAFISLVDEHRDFYKSACGFGEPLASARELTGPTFCHFAVQSAAPLVIPDTAADPVYREVPTVRSLGVAAYVGIPLVVHGQVIGSFCGIDMKPRAWTADDVETLTELAASAQREIELRAALAEARRMAADLEELARELALQVAESEALAIELKAMRTAA
jgi:GAF domain-containing protein